LTEATATDAEAGFGDERPSRPRWASWSGRALGAVRGYFAPAQRLLPTSLLDRRMRQASLLIGGCLSLLWFVHLARISHAQWLNANVSYDFSIFNQPYYLIAHGHLNPFDSVFGTSYLRSHFELIMWILAPTWWITRSGEMLLYIQDAALAGGGFAVARWGCLLASASLASKDTAGLPERVLRVVVLPVTGLCVLMRSQDVSDSMREDFHFQAVSTFFLLMAATELSMRRRRGFVWVGAALLCGDVAGTYLAGLGLSVLLALNGRRLWGILLIGIGAVWVLAMSHFHFNYGTPEGGFAYLAGVTDPLVKVSLLTIAANIVLHPTRPWRMLYSRRHRMWHHLAGTGSIGVLHPWAIGICGVVLASNNLALPDAFGVLEFQSVPVYFFSVAGLVFTLDLTIGWAFRVPRPALRAVVVGVACLLSIAIVGRSVLWRTLDVRFPSRYHIDAVAAGEINRIAPRIGSGDAVISAFGVAGRFSGRQDIQLIKFAGQPIIAPKGQRTVIVLVESGNMGVPEACLRDTASWAAGLPGAETWVQQQAIQVYAVTPTADQTFVVPADCGQ
jgi:hypothetical protein